MPPTEGFTIPATPTAAQGEVAAILAELARTAEPQQGRSSASRYLTPAARLTAYRASNAAGAAPAVRRLKRVVAGDEGDEP